MPRITGVVPSRLSVRVPVLFSTVSLVAAVAALLSLTGCSGGSSSHGGGGTVPDTGTQIDGQVGVPGEGQVLASKTGVLMATAQRQVVAATVEVLDDDGNVVKSTTTDESGNYSMKVPDGNYTIGVRVGTTDYFVPLKSPVIIDGDEVHGADAVGGVETLDFEIPPPSTTVTGTVTNGGNGVADIGVQFVDAESEEVRYGVTTDSNGAFSVAVLPNGNFTVRVDASTVGTGLAGSSPQNLAVTAAGASPETLAFTLEAATSIRGTIDATEGASLAIGELKLDEVAPPRALPALRAIQVPEGAAVVVSELGKGEIERVAIDTDGTYTLKLRDGSYRLEFLGFSADVIAPAPIRITVKDSLVYVEGQDVPIDPAVTALSVVAFTATATLTGTVTLDGAAITAVVSARDVSTLGVVAKAETNSSGAFSMPLAAGSYDIFVRKSFLPPGVVPPQPIRVSIESTGAGSANVLEDSGTANDGVIAFALKSASVSLTGTVGDGTNTFKDVRVVAKKGDEQVGRAVTNNAGAYTLQLPLGTVDIVVVPESIPLGVLPPDPVTLEITSSGGTVTITGAGGTITTLDFVLTTRTPNVTGTITFDFDGDETVEAGEVVGCRIVVGDPDDEKELFDTGSDPATGAYSLILKNGTFLIGVDPESLPPGASPTPPQRVSVTADGVTTEDGTTAASVTIDFELIRRTATLEGVVTTDGRAASVGLALFDTGRNQPVGHARSDQVTGAYRLPVFPGAYELRVNPDTLPPGVALPNPIQISVSQAGVISTTDGVVAAVNVALTRSVATLTGVVSVVRGAETFFVDVDVVVRNPQNHTFLRATRTDPTTGAYSLTLAAGNWEIAVDPGSMPPGVLPPRPVVVSVTGTTVSGNGVSSNALNFTFEDVRSSGAEISGRVVMAGGQGLLSELRLFDPRTGSERFNFILAVRTAPDGTYSFRATEGTYKLKVLPQSLPPTAVPPTSQRLAVQAGSPATVLEDNTVTPAGAPANAENDGTINFVVRDGSTADTGIMITGVVTETVPQVGTFPLGAVNVQVLDSATDEIVAQTMTEFGAGRYRLRLPLGSYSLLLNRDSLPFHLVPPQPVAILAALQDANIVVNTDNGATVTASDCSGNPCYEFDLAPTSADQEITGTVTAPGGGGLRVFVVVEERRDHRFVMGHWSDSATGNYRLHLSPGSYEIGIDPASLPAGTTAPAPVDVTVTETSVLEASGTENDADVDFALVSAAQQIAGTVQDGSSNGFGCFVEVHDATTNDFLGGAPTEPATGAYSISMPPGTYNVGVAPPSLPPGFAPPAPQRVQVTSGSNATANFVLNTAGTCITGVVLTATDLRPLPVFIVLEEPSTGQFINGVPNDPGTGEFRLCAPAGAYKVFIEPESLPLGMIIPDPVRVQVDGANFQESNTVGDGNIADDGIINFRVTEAGNLATSLAQLTGTVTLSDSGQTIPMGTFVFIEDAADKRFVAGRPTNPADGTYSIFLPAGTYDVLLDGGTLPPGVSLPDPRRISVAIPGGGAEPVITQQVEGVPVISSEFDFSLARGGNSITGTVTLGGQPVHAFVVAIDPASDRVIFGVPTAPDGSYQLSLPDGAFQVAVDPPSLPPGLLPPPLVSVIVAGGFIAEGAGTSNDGVVPFTLTESGASVAVIVQDNDEVRMFAHILVINRADSRIAAEGPTDPGHAFPLALPDGIYDLIVDPASLPPDVAPAIPSRLTVAGTDVTLTSAGSGALANDTLTITVQRQAQAGQVTVRIQDSDTNPYGGAVRVQDAAGNILFNLGVPPDPNGVPLILGPGDFSLAIDPGSVPPGASLPDPVAVSVAGSPRVATPSAVTLVLRNERVTLTGTVYGAVNDQGTTIVDLDLYNGEGFLIHGAVPLVRVGETNNATYSVELGEGTYELAINRAPGVDSGALIIPGGQPVTVSDGVIQNPDDDAVTEGTQVDIVIPSIVATAGGSVTLDSNGLSGVFVVARDPVDNTIINDTVTAPDGTYAIALPAGFYQILPEPGSLAVVAPGAVPPSFVEVDVTPSGDISVIGSPSLCAGAGPDEACTDIDFVIASFNQNSDALIAGTVTARRTSTATPIAVPGAEVLLIDPASERPRSSAFTDGAGAYQLFAPPGVWYVVVDPHGIALTFPTIPAAPVRVGVEGTALIEDDTTGTGNEIDDGTVNFVLAGASAMVQGQVRSSSGISIGCRLVVSTADRSEIPEDFAYTLFTDPGGHFFMPVGEGNFKLWVAPESLPPGFLPPGPTTFSVSGTTVTENDTEGTGNADNDGTINPVVETGGGAIYGRVLNSQGNPLPLFVGLLIPSANPNEPPRFVMGAPTDPGTGNFEITSGDGSYFLEVDPHSLPPGVQPPPRVNLSVATSGETTTVTFSDSATTIDDGGLTRVVLQAGSAAGAVRGSVKTSQGNPLPANVAIFDAASNRFIRDVFTHHSDGRYDVHLGDGAYDLRIEPFSLPPGIMPPAGVRVSVSGSTVSEANTAGVDPEGGADNVANDGVVNFVPQGSAAFLSGYVRDEFGNGMFAHVDLLAQDPSGNYSIFVSGGPTAPDGSGFFSIPVSDGTYRTGMEPGSVPPGMLLPPPVVISVATTDGATTISFPPTATTVTEGEETRLVLELQSGGGGVSGAVTQGEIGVNAHIFADDSATGQFMGGTHTDPQGDYHITLPPGTYVVQVDPFSLPHGTPPPQPQTVVVDADTIVEDVGFSLGAAQATFRGYILMPADGVDTSAAVVDCSAITTNPEVYPVGCGVQLMIPSNDANTPPTHMAGTWTDHMDGYFAFPLSEGNFQIQVDGGSLPPGALPPPPIQLTVRGETVTVDGETLDCSNDAERKFIFLQTGGTMLDGMVQFERSPGVYEGMGAFVEAIDPTEGHHFAGSPAHPPYGEFHLPIGDRIFNVRVDPFSLPPGFTAPPPVRVSVSDGQIQVETTDGVTYENNLLRILLSMTSTSVSGTIRDGDGSGVPARLQAFDGSGNYRGDSHSDHMTGSYMIPLPPGSYRIEVDSHSLPPGVAAPSPINIVIGETSLTDQNFTLGTAPATITGRVYFVDGEGTEIGGIPAYVEIHDAVHHHYVAGRHAEPNAQSQFTYSLSVGAGSFRVSVGQFSLPPGFLPPDPVDVTVSVNPIDGSATITESAHGDDSTLDDGIINFALTQGGATLSGRLVDGQGFGINGYVRVHPTTGEHHSIAESPTDPNGNFSLSFNDGSYDMVVDPPSLPPGFLPPPPVRLVVVGDTISVDGVAVTGTYELTVNQAAVSLSGQVTDSTGQPLPNAFVVLDDPSSHRFVGGRNTSPNGYYDIAVGDGTYLVRVDPFSVPPGWIPPDPTTITVSGETITVDGSPITELDFQMLTAAASISVAAVDARGDPVFCQVEVRTTTDNHVTNAHLGHGPSPVSLPAGNFMFFIPAWSLPGGMQSPPPHSVSVSAEGVVGDSSGLPDDSFVQFVLQGSAATITGSVVLQGSPPTPLPGVEIFAIDMQSDFDVSQAHTDGLGQFSIGLPIGEFELEVDWGLPADAVPPPPMLVRVMGPNNTQPPSPVTIVVPTRTAVMTGTVTVDGQGVEAEVLALVVQGQDVDDASWAESAVSGAYELPLGVGSFVLIAELADPPPQFIPPLPVTVTVPESQSLIELTQDFEFFTPAGQGAPPSHTLTGSLQAAGVTIDAPVLILQGADPMTLIEPVGGSYSVALPADQERQYTVMLFEDELPPDFTAPSPVTITVNGDGITGDGVTQQGEAYVLNFQLGLDGVVVNGTVRDAEGNPVAGVDVETERADSFSPGPRTTTNAQGEYSLTMMSGSWEIELWHGIPAGSVKPLFVEFGVVDNQGTMELVIDGQAVPNGVIDWNLGAGRARVTGQLRTDQFPISGEIIAVDPTTNEELVLGDAWGGTFDFWLPAGDFILVPAGEDVPPASLMPNAVEVTVPAEGEIMLIEHDFIYTAISATAPGQALSVRGFVNGLVANDEDIGIYNDQGVLIGLAYTNDMGCAEISLPVGTYDLGFALIDGATTTEVVVTAFEATVGGTPIEGNFLPIIHGETPAEIGSCSPGGPPPGNPPPGDPPQ